jgi:hypothetical protein
MEGQRLRTALDAVRAMHMSKIRLRYSPTGLGERVYSLRSKGYTLFQCLNLQCLNLSA